MASRETGELTGMILADPDLNLFGSFRKLRAPYLGVLIIRILLFRVLSPIFGTPPAPPFLHLKAPLLFCIRLGVQVKLQSSVLKAQVISVLLVLMYCLWDEANYQKCYFKAEMRQGFLFLKMTSS